MTTVGPRLGFVSPEASDAATELRLAIAANATIGETLAPADSGLLSARPTPGVRDRFFFTTDTQVLYRDSGTAWAAVGWQQSMVHAYNADAAFTVSPATWTKVKLNAVDFDPRGWMSTSLYRFTPTVAGFYEISAYVQTLDSLSAGTRLQLVLYKNGSAFRQLNYSNAPANDVVSMQGAVQVQATGSDYFEVFFRHEDTVSGVRRLGSGGAVYFDARLVGA